jgi:hypothetical protein
VHEELADFEEDKKTVSKPKTHEEDVPTYFQQKNDLMTHIMTAHPQQVPHNFGHEW